MKPLCCLVLFLYRCHGCLIEGGVLMLMELVLAEVRIKEHGYQVRWIEVSLLVVLP
jgi:hypothetical protein